LKKANRYQRLSIELS
jgi:hypothetical protein